MIKLNEVSVNYGTIKALDKISIEVKRGQIVCLIGANAAGKSTCLKSISGLVQCSEGEIIYDGSNINKYSIGQRVSSGIIHLLEGRRLFKDQAVEDNLMLAAYLRLKDSSNAVQQDMESIYQRFPILYERRKQIAGTLSGGEQQMLIISQALLAKPKLLLLDEPSMGLAPIIVQHLFDYLLELRDDGLTILMVEQFAAQAFSIADHIYILQLGKIVADESCQELSSKDVKYLINMYMTEKTN